MTLTAAGGDDDGKKKRRKKKVTSSSSGGGGGRDAGVRSAGGSRGGGLRIIDDEADMEALDKRRVNKAWQEEETAGAELSCVPSHARLTCWYIT